MRPPLRLRVAALVKQVPHPDHLALGADGRIRRTDTPGEMSAYCRRAVAQGMALARDTGGRCTVFTLGPPQADAVLREALAYGADRAVHLCDPTFAGSDTLATAHALSAALALEGPFDLVLTGRNSLDGDTGQVGPQVAQLLGLPFATGVRQLTLRGDPAGVEVGCEHDDEWVLKRVRLPAVLSVAERLIAPCKVKDHQRLDAVDPSTIHRLRGADLGIGPWGERGSVTAVGDMRSVVHARRHQRLGDQEFEPIRAAVGAIQSDAPSASIRLPSPTRTATGPTVAVVAEPDRPQHTREMVGGAARLADLLGAPVTALTVGNSEGNDSTRQLASWGADRRVCLVETMNHAGRRRGIVEEDVANALVAWARQAAPQIILGPSTSWGREVLGRLAAATRSGLVGDAVDLELDADRRLVAWKPAFGGQVVAAIHALSSIQMATVRAGALPAVGTRDPTTIDVALWGVVRRGRTVVDARRVEDIDDLVGASRVVVVGQGVDPLDYPRVRAAADRLGAVVAATRKVTDQGWQPRSRQVGITGLTIRPQVAVLLGVSGSFNHLVGLRDAGLIVAVNRDAAAPVFDAADFGIVADWRAVIDNLVEALPVTARCPSALRS